MWKPRAIASGACFMGSVPSPLTLTILFGFAFAGEALGGRTDDSLLWSLGESILKGLFVLLASTCWKLCNHSRS